MSTSFLGTVTIPRIIQDLKSMNGRSRLLYGFTGAAPEELEEVANELAQSFIREYDVVPQVVQFDANNMPQVNLLRNYDVIIVIDRSFSGLSSGVIHDRVRQNEMVRKINHCSQIRPNPLVINLTSANQGAVSGDILFGMGSGIVYDTDKAVVFRRGEEELINIATNNFPPRPQRYFTKRLIAD